MMGVRGKLLAPLIVLGFSFTAILHLYWYPQFQKTESIALQQRELETMEVVATMLATPLLAGDLAQVHTTLDQLQGRQTGWTEIQLKSSDGHNLYPTTTKSESSQGSTAQLLSIPIDYDGSRLATLEVKIDSTSLLASQLAQIQALERMLLMLLLGIIVLAGLLQDRWIRRPLKALVDATSGIANGNFKMKLPKASSRDEVGSLISTFDTMRANLENREKRLASQHALLDTIHTAQAGYISDTDAEDLFRKLIGDIVTLTESAYGFIGEIRYRDGKPFLKTFAIRNNTWDEATRRFHNENDSQGMEFSNMQSLYGAVITSGKPVIANEPSNDPRTGTMTDEHTSMDAFLGIPFLRDDKVIGMFGIANRPGGYGQSLVNYLQPVTSTCSHIVDALRTERQRIAAEGQLREREIRMRTIFENVVDGIFTTNRRGDIESFNTAAEKMFGYTAEEVIGRDVSMLIPEMYRNEHDKYVDRDLEAEKKKISSSNRGFKGMRKDGSTFPLEIAVNVMRLGEEKYFCSIVRDVTERKKIDRMKNEFVSTVSHELRTPLTSIRGSLGLLTGGAAGELPQQAMSLLDIAGNNTERLLLLINDILDIEKIESGQMTFKFRKVSVNELLAQAIQANETYASQHGVKLKLAGSDSDYNIYADQDRLIQVMNNLLSNAVKFSPDGGTVEVISNYQKGMIRCSITDHGAGIPEEFHSKLFDKFTQSDASDTRSIGGTGLGMNITKAIVLKHGGIIDFITHKNIGTTVYFEMPVMNDISDSKELDELANGIQRTEQRVLIVEDDPDVASLLRIMLAQAGFNADIALDASQARQHLSEKQYAALTMDIMLPDQDGISLIRELRQDDSTKNLPIIVVSAKADTARRQLSGGALSVVDWLNKPIDQSRLLSTINQITMPRDKPVILHVEDEPDVHMIVSTLLKDTAKVIWAPTLRDAQKHLEEYNFDLALLDICLPDGSSLQLMDTLNQHTPPIPAVMFSAQDIDESLAHQVGAALVKSKTSNNDLVDTIKSLLANTQIDGEFAETVNETLENELSIKETREVSTL